MENNYTNGQGYEEEEIEEEEEEEVEEASNLFDFNNSFDEEEEPLCPSLQFGFNELSLNNFFGI